MSWQEQNAVKRIFNAFKRNKKQIYNEDIQALETIITSLENNKRAYVNDNLLYAKLLCVHLIQNVDFYKDINFAKNKVLSDLNKPLSYHILLLEKHLNDAELLNYFYSFGIKDWRSEMELKDNEKIITENQKELIERIKKSWSYDEVEKSFYNTANTFLKDINNYQQ